MLRQLRILLGAPLSAALMTCPWPTFAASYSAKQVEAKEAAFFCPTLGQPGLRLGEPRWRQDQALVARLKKLPAEYAPFTEADLDYSEWSGRLASITYRGESPDGAVNVAWMAGVEKNLREAGWTESTGNDLSAAFLSNPKSFEKQVNTSQGSQMLFLEFEANGAVMLRCGNARLVEISKEERDGQLEPGTPRPVTAPTTPAPLPNQGDCASPAVLAAFSQPGKVDESSPAIRALTLGGHQRAEQALEIERLHTWLSWKLRMSGKVDQERLWKIEETVAASEGKDNAGTEAKALLHALSSAAQGQGSPAATCRSMVALMNSMGEMDEREIARRSRINRALEAEARRLGIDLK